MAGTDRPLPLEADRIGLKGFRKPDAALLRDALLERPVLKKARRRVCCRRDIRKLFRRADAPHRALGHAAVALAVDADRRLREVCAFAKARPTVAAWSEMDNELTNAMTAVVNGEKTAQEAMDELAVVFDELLKP